MLKALNAAGTYDFKSRPDKQEELARLRRQAGIANEAERAMWKQAGLRSGMSVLDLGCGPGVVACSLAAEIGEGSVVGADLSEELLSVARGHQERLGLPNLSFVKENVYELSFPDGSFDFVNARFLFQHLRDPARGFSEILRVLKPGGRLCLMDIDDRFLLLSPTPPSFEALRAAGVAAQAAEGGNREIGGTLFGMLQGAGFAGVQTLVNVIRSEDCGMKTFLDVAIRFRATRLAGHPGIFSAEKLGAALGELKALEAEPGAWGAVAMFVGVGVKPGARNSS